MSICLLSVADGLSDRDVVTNGWLSPADPALSGFETELVKTTGRLHAVVHAGARLLLLDVEPGTWTMDAGLVADELDRRIVRSCCCTAVQRQHCHHRQCKLEVDDVSHSELRPRRQGD